MKNIRVRFAPSPTGLMHLGNVRAALINYLFARQNNGTFILRIEDTDPERNFDPGAIKILEDLKWLNLSYDEGPPALEPFGSYFQSQRTQHYQKALEQLKEKKLIYRCFCTEEELEKKRTRQKALKQPPRYDRACANLTQEVIQIHLNEKKSFVWRFKIDHTQKITITDLARKSVTFDLKNYSDFPLTRGNGSFTFIFANVVDDIAMRISHVFRGEDHLSNTGNQAALYVAFQAQLPTFWHMPILCNVEGRKLSKRDFGFSLQDLRNAGYLPEAILNYLAIIGGSFKNEIMSLNELIEALDFNNPSGAGQIKYDVKKLTWINHQWILGMPTEKLLSLTKEFILKEFPTAKNLSNEQLMTIIKPIQGELNTLNDITTHCAFYFNSPKNACGLINEIIPQKELSTLIKIITSLDQTIPTDQYINTIKKEAKKESIPAKFVFSFLRLALTGSQSGPSVIDIINLLGIEESKKRIYNIAQSCS